MILLSLKVFALNRSISLLSLVFSLFPHSIHPPCASNSRGEQGPNGMTDVGSVPGICPSTGDLENWARSAKAGAHHDVNGPPTVLARQRVPHIALLGAVPEAHAEATATHGFSARATAGASLRRRGAAHGSDRMGTLEGGNAKHQLPRHTKTIKTYQDNQENYLG